MVNNVNQVMSNDTLAQLVQKQNFVGWVYYIDYDTAKVMTNDFWKQRVAGIPHNSFLVASTFDPDSFAKTSEADREVILLRVVGTSALPQDDDLIRTKIDHFQAQEEIYNTDDERDYDDLTLNQLQFGGLECRVLGTFFKDSDDNLKLGSDLESFATAARLSVFRPREDALKTIVNYVDPIRKRDAEEEAKRLGRENAIEPFNIGTVRYTSTDRQHRKREDDLVSVSIQPSDFLSRRTAVLSQCSKVV